MDAAKDYGRYERVPADGGHHDASHTAEPRRRPHRLVAASPGIAAALGSRDARPGQLRQHLQPSRPGGPEPGGGAAPLLLVGRHERPSPRSPRRTRRADRPRGIAMAALENPFVWPPTPKMLADGTAAVARARAAGAKSPRELDYIAAIETFYKDHDKVEHRIRARGLREGDGAARGALPRRPGGRDLLRARAERHRPGDRQDLRPADEGGRDPRGVFREQPNHPGRGALPHPHLRLPRHRGERGSAPPGATRPSRRRRPHAQHMPSHIFTRRGYWQDSITSNLASAAAADNDFDRFHAWDYLVYAHLQPGQDQSARGVHDQILCDREAERPELRGAFAWRPSPRATRWSAASGPTPPPSPSGPATSRGRAFLSPRRSSSSHAASAPPGPATRPGPGRPGSARGAARRAAGGQGRVLGRSGGHPAAAGGRVDRARGRPQRRRPSARAGRGGPGGRHGEAPGDAGERRPGARGPRRGPARPRPAGRGPP